MSVANQLRIDDATVVPRVAKPDDGSGSREAEQVDPVRVRPLRRHQRLTTAIRAVLYHQQSFQPTTIRDVSCGGLGLEGARGLFPGDAVRVRLITGHEYNGTVRWWLNGHCGISFESVLEPFDRLIALAEKKSRQSNVLTSGEA
jgi:hypothetical protein